MAGKAIYYAKIGSLGFYDSEGVICGGVTGRMAQEKYVSIVRRGSLPRVSLSDKVAVKIEY